MFLNEKKNSSQSSLSKLGPWLLLLHSLRMCLHFTLMVFGVGFSLCGINRLSLILFGQTSSSRRPIKWLKTKSLFEGFGECLLGINTFEINYNNSHDCNVVPKVIGVIVHMIYKQFI